jgi:hypothetical protein
MRKVHLIFGTVVVVFFLLTGLYMYHYYHGMAGVPDAPRLLFRTRHIFILLSGLLNLTIGAYFSYRIQPWRRTAQLLGSLLVIVAPVLFAMAFFYEPGLTDLHVPLSLWGTFTVTGGTILHVLSGAKSKDQTQ